MVAPVARQVKGVLPIAQLLSVPERRDTLPGTMADARGTPTRSVLVISPFIWEAGWGKGKPTVYYCLRGFQEAGYDVHVLTCTNRDKDTEILDGLTVHYIRIPLNVVDFDYDAVTSFLTHVRTGSASLARHTRFRLWWLQFVLLGCRRAAAVAERIQPILTYGVNNPGIPVAVHVARRRGIPCFARIMGSEIAQAAGLAPDGGARAGESAPFHVPWYRMLALWLVRFDELLAFKLPTDARIVTDDGQIGRRAILDWLGVPPERLWLWRNGVDKQALAAAPDRLAARRALGIDADRPVVLWVSQLTDWKRPGLLVEAAPTVLAACPRTLFLVVGDGPERERLAARAAELGVGSAVRFEGFVARADVPPYYRSADVFVAAYRRSNVSNTLLEAMAAGLPAVTVDNGLTGEVARDGVNSLLVQEEQLGELGARVIDVLSDADLAQQLSDGARAFAERHLETWDERIAREMEAIAAIVARRGSDAQE